jgi:hypothetical protein
MTPARFRDAFAAFDAEHGWDVLNALQNQARHMTEAAADAQKAVDAAAADPEVAARMDASMVTVNGYAQMTQMFTDAAARAAKAAEAWEALQEAAEEDA